MRRRFNAVAIVGLFWLSALNLAGCGSSSGESSAEPPPPQTLKVSGNKIVDPAGNEISLRGFQGLAAYPIPDERFLQAVFDLGIDSYDLDAIAEDIRRYSFTDFDIEEIKSTGANVVRLWTRVYEIKRGPNEYSETALRMLEETISRFGAQGIRTVLVLAGAGENNYEAQQPYLDRGINLWDPTSSARADSIEVWGVLSTRFADNAYVAAYEVMNEPMPPTAQALHNFYVDAIAAIRANDRDHIVILAVAERNEETFQIGGTYEDDNLAVTFHFYYPHDFTLEPEIPDLTYPGTYDSVYFDEAFLNSIFDNAVSLSQLQGKPIYVGEFGAGGERDGNGGLEWTQDVLDAMNARGLHYTYHLYRHRVHRGYWTTRPEVEAQVQALLTAIFDGSMSYWDLTEDEKRNLFMTELSCDQRAGIKAILTSAFATGG